MYLTACKLDSIEKDYLEILQRKLQKKHKINPLP